MPELFGWGKNKVRQRLKQKNMDIYIPDFTAKALGLTVKAKSTAQLKKMLKMTYSGLEVRRGVVA